MFSFTYMHVISFLNNTSFTLHNKTYFTLVILYLEKSIIYCQFIIMIQGFTRNILLSKLKDAKDEKRLKIPTFVFLFYKSTTHGSEQNMRQTLWKPANTWTHEFVKNKVIHNQTYRLGFTKILPSPIPQKRTTITKIQAYHFSKLDLNYLPCLLFLYFHFIIYSLPNKENTNCNFFTIQQHISINSLFFFNSQACT